LLLAYKKPCHFFQKVLSEKTKPPGMQASIFSAGLSQARINWVVPGRVSGIKMVEIAEFGAPISVRHIN